MDTVINRSPAKLNHDSKFILHRVTNAGTSELVTTANTFEQACDLARSDRARLRDLNQISGLNRHDVVTRATGVTRSIQVPR